MSGAPLDEEAIFKVAYQIASPQARADYLAQVCGQDRALFERVDLLLRLHDQQASFLESPSAASLATSDLALSEQSGTVIGPYKLLKQIGEGGMGVVYMAEQATPVQRKVALKLIKSGMDSKQVIARFEAERQALAMMDHVNIARVLDAGAADNGRPYFVMELVHGLPITQFCDDNRLTPRERLELFVPVCQAIQHAHQKGIIHRDIKPTNVLITLYDGQPTAKVIDFGVAKATEQRLTERTLVTQHGTLVGTLEYMSPEQAETSAQSADTRSDIYSLGVLLYELLTGSTPLTGKRVREAAYGDVLRMIKEEEPPKPSTRLSESGEARASISVQRQMEPAKLVKLVRGELDWIVMKALEKDRNRRYETAGGLADDVQRYLKDEAVQACPPSARYRFHKFARRNKIALTTVCLVAAVLVVGVAVSTSQALRAMQAENQANANEAQARAAMESERQAKKAEATQRQRAEANFEKAREAVDQMLTRVADNQLKDVPQMEQIRAELLEQALRFHQGFLEERSTDPSVRNQTANAFLKVGRIQNQLDRRQESEQAYRQALQIYEELAAAFPENEHYCRMLASTLESLIEAVMWQGRDVEAEAIARRGLAVVAKMMTDFPQTARDYRVNEAECLFWLGNVHWNLGQLAEAEAVWRKTLAIYLTLAAEQPDSQSIAARVGACYLNLGITLTRTGTQQDAEMAQRQALEVLEKLVADSPAASLHRYSLSVSYGGLGNLLKDKGDIAGAEAFYRKNVDVLERLVSDFPNRPRYAFFLGDSHHNLGSFLLGKTDRLPEVETAFLRAVYLYDKLAREFPNRGEYGRRLEGCLGTLGTIHYRAKHYQAAIAALERSIALRGTPGEPKEWLYLALSHHQLRNKQEARKWYVQAVEWMEQNQSDDEELHRFRAEADALLGSSVTPTPDGHKTCPMD